MIDRADRAFSWLANGRVVVGLAALAAAGVAFALVGLPVPGALVVGWLVVVPFVVIARAVPREDRPAVGLLVAGGVLLRLAIAAVIDAYLRSAVFTFFDDSQLYETLGGALAEGWRTGHPADLGGYTYYGFYYVVAAVDFVCDGGPFVVATLNAAVAGVTAAVLYRVAAELGASRPARLLAVAFGMFMPSILFWSVIPLKDTLVSLLFVLGILGALRLNADRPGRRIAWLATVAVCMALMSTLRSYSPLFILFFSLAAIAFSQVWRRRPLWSAVAVVAIVATEVGVFLGPIGSQTVSEVVDPRTVDHIRLLMSQGRSTTTTTTTGEGGVLVTPSPEPFLPPPSATPSTATPPPATTPARTATPAPTAPPASSATPSAVPVAANTCTSVSLTPSPDPPQPAGTTVTWTAAASGCASPMYFFWLQTKGVNSVARYWSPKASATWNTTGLAPDEYVVIVDVQDEGLNATPAETSVRYALTPAVPPTAAPLAVPPGVRRYAQLAAGAPLNALLFLILPIPFVTPGNLVGLAVPEMLAWYVMLPLGVVGLVVLWRRDRLRTAAFVLLVLGIAAAYGTIVGNAGALLRYRAQDMLLLSVPISVGALEALRWWRSRRARRG